VENWMEPPRNPNCSIAPTTLTPTSYGVVHVVLPKQGGGYVHRMIWSNRTCTPTCNYRYTVTSASGPGSSQTSQPTQFSIPVCID
jgi:hypothetical protein